ncbi:MAG: DNA-directed DNA polymerase II small subunit [Candidatus Micrarchaeota archaeon]|nr:DNA-directed DNA polymerase II small subunit [Candidatus Micrarchaeota archaeon]
MAVDAVAELAKRLASAKVLVAADVRAETVSRIDLDVLVAKIIERHTGEELSFVDEAEIAMIADTVETEKAPRPIEITMQSDFKPAAAEYDSNYQIVDGKDRERVEGTVNDFVEHFRNRLARIRELMGVRGGISWNGSKLESLKSMTDGREVVITGIVSNKVHTKNGNIMLMIEDETGSARAIFMNGGSERARELFEKAGTIVNDEIIGVKGKVSGPFVIVNEMIWPDVPIHEKKSTEEDLAIAFISDTHVGSKLFMEKNLAHMLKWLKGGVDSKSKAIAGKIKYIVVGGDIADGIGVYPRQERDLAVLDVYAQYRIFFSFLQQIPDYIQVFVIPGNHDAVQRAEPQPPFNEDILQDFKQHNVKILPNPSYLRLHGIDVLTYHGTSLDSVIAAVPGSSYARPEKAMLEILKRRHLSPIYGGNIIVPTKNDSLVIDRIPDILHMGHIHKNGLTEYHGVDIVNSGTWQDRTDFQIQQGHIPTPCLMPVFETKTHNFTTINFAND